MSEKTPRYYDRAIKELFRCWFEECKADEQFEPIYLMPPTSEARHLELNKRLEKIGASGKPALPKKDYSDG